MSITINEPAEGSFVRKVPGVGDVALMCAHALTAVPGAGVETSLWFSVYPPAEVVDPKHSGNLEASWMVACKGCALHAPSPANIQYTRHMWIVPHSEGRLELAEDFVVPEGAPGSEAQLITGASSFMSVHTNKKEANMKTIQGLMVEVPGSDLKELFVRQVQDLRDAVGVQEASAAERAKKKAALDDVGIGGYTQDRLLDPHCGPSLLDQTPETLIVAFKRAADGLEQYASYIDADTHYVLAPHDFASIGRMGPIDVERAMTAALRAPIY